MKQAKQDWKPVWITGGFVVAGGLLLFLLSRATPGLWNEWHCQNYIHNFFCEHTDMRLPMRQFWNVWSNLGHIAVSGYIFASLAKPGGLRKGWTVIYGLAYFLVFFGSSFFHASLTITAERFDLSGVYAVTLTPLIWGIQRHASHSLRPWINGGGLLAWALMSVFCLQLPNHWVVPGMIILLILFTLREEWVHPLPGSIWLALGAAACIGIGITAFAFDIRRVYCFPHGIPPHAIWHLLAAGSGYFFFRYMTYRETHSYYIIRK